MSKSTKTRRIHQADYQRAYREQQKAIRKPTRDDVARLALYFMIREGLKDGHERSLADWCETLTNGLVEQGFDPEATLHRLHQLIDRYADGWSFQLKRHLTQHTVRQPQSNCIPPITPSNAVDV
ncbi:hypothetical protein [Rhodopseudomonas palustris]|nr:hypothetical protein [Rhodopseudomonas palustris]